jgi:hypothetical protein
MFHVITFGYAYAIGGRWILLCERDFGLLDQLGNAYAIGGRWILLCERDFGLIDRLGNALTCGSGRLDQGRRGGRDGRRLIGGHRLTG